MSNENCLEGMACPKCKSEEPFKISMTSLFTIYDSSTDDNEDTEWDEKSYCECCECGHYGIVKDFQSNQTLGGKQDAKRIRSKKRS